MVIWKHKVTMDLSFNCTPPEASTDDVLDIARLAFTRITNFLAGEGIEPPIGKARKRLDSESGILHVTIKIPTPPETGEAVPDGPSLAEVGALYTKLKNNLALFPPMVDNDLPAFKFLAKAFPDPE